MSAGWPSVNAANYLSYPNGSFDGIGAYTIAMLVDLGGNDARLASWFASATEKGQFLHDSGALYGGNDFTSGFATGLTGSSSWAVLAFTKPSGSAHYRMHSWLYAADGSGTMAHGEAASAANHANETGPTTAVRVGYSSGTSMSGDIAVAAFWDRALSDAELNTLKTNELVKWASLEPDLGLHFGSWNGSIGSDVMFAGTSGAGTENGTVDVGSSNPPSFDFTASYPGASAAWLAAVDSFGPAAHWRMGEASGGTMSDRSGNARHGTHTGVTYGAFGSVVDDNDDAIAYAGSSGSHSDVTYASWMNPGVQAISWVAAVKYIASTAGPFFFFSRDGTTSYQQGLYFASGNLAFGVNTSSSSLSATSPLQYNDGVYHLCIGTWTPTNGIRLYVDGVLVATQALGGTLDTTANNIQMGGRGGNYAVCTVDECIDYPGIELTQAEVDVLFNAWALGAAPPAESAPANWEHSGAFILEQGGGILMTEGV